MTTSLLQHDVLPYSGPDGFVGAAVTVVADALAQHAVPVVLAEPHDIARVRMHFGGPADAAIVALDMSVAGRNPARLLPALQHIVDEHPSRRIVCVGEPIRPSQPPAVVREIELHERLLALPAFRPWNCRLMCAYDVCSLSPTIIEKIETIHAAVAGDPVVQVERVRAGSLPPLPTGAAEFSADRTTLGALRGFVQRQAQHAGLDSERAEDLVYAVNEAVTNSICHGEGRARVSFWSDAATVTCEVRDRGWIRDPLVGRIAPRPNRMTGRGLWLINHLCDLVELRSSAVGTTVRMHVDL